MLVSVVIPTYNRASIVPRAIKSALNQSYHDLEIIVVDDGSTDETLDVLRQFGESIRVVTQANAGPSKARNHGVAEAKGEIIAFLDSDDIWLPEKIARQVEVLKRGGEDMGCCVSNCLFVDTGASPLTSFGVADLSAAPEYGVLHNPAEIMASRFLMFNQVVAIRKSAFEKAGGFDGNLWILEDYHLALKLSALGCWGVVASPQVVKFEEADSLGCAARMDPVGHMRAVEEIFALFLEESQPAPDANLRKIISRSRKRIRFQVRANHLRHSASPFISLLGRSQLLLERIGFWCRRRTSLYPRPVFTSLAAPVK